MSESDQKFYLELTKNFRLYKDDLIYPIFITEMGKYHQFGSMPGIFQIPYHKIIDSVGDVVDKGLNQSYCLEYREIKLDMVLSRFQLTELFKRQ
jgi:delta-aminolevulinic acid dehydratase/porphobilinogen synthase